MVEEASDLACAGEVDVSLKVSISPLGHLAQDGPGVSVNGEDDEDLEGVEAFERGLVGVPRSKVGGKLNKAAAFQLAGAQTWQKVMSQQRVTWANNRSGKGNDRWDTGKVVHRRKESGKDALVACQPTLFGAPSHEVSLGLTAGNLGRERRGRALCREECRPCQTLDRHAARLPRQERTGGHGHS